MNKSGIGNSTQQIQEYEDLKNSISKFHSSLSNIKNLDNLSVAFCEGVIKEISTLKSELQKYGSHLLYDNFYDNFYTNIITHLASNEVVDKIQQIDSNAAKFLRQQSKINNATFTDPIKITTNSIKNQEVLEFVTQIFYIRKHPDVYLCDKLSEFHDPKKKKVGLLSEFENHLNEVTKSKKEIDEIGFFYYLCRLFIFGFICHMLLKLEHSQKIDDLKNKIKTTENIKLLSVNYVVESLQNVHKKLTEIQPNGIIVDDHVKINADKINKFLKDNNLKELNFAPKPSYDKKQSPESSQIRKKSGDVKNKNEIINPYFSAIIYQKLKALGHEITEVKDDTRANVYKQTSLAASQIQADPTNYNKIIQESKNDNQGQQQGSVDGNSIQEFTIPNPNPNLNPKDIKSDHEPKIESERQKGLQKQTKDLNIVIGL